MGSEGNADGAQIQKVLHTVVSSGSIASYITSPQGFQFRRLGTGEPILEPGVPSSSFSDSCGSPLSISTMGSLSLGLLTTRGRELTTLGAHPIDLFAALAWVEQNWFPPMCTH